MNITLHVPSLRRRTHLPPPWTHDASTATAHAAPPRSRLPTTMDRWQRRALALLLLLHGIAHVAGTTEALTARGDEQSIDYLLGWWEIAGTTQLAVIAIAWALVAIDFAIAAGMVLAGSRRWPAAVEASAYLSLVLCLLALPSAAIGLTVSAALLVIVRWARSTRID